MKKHCIIWFGRFGHFILSKDSPLQHVPLCLKAFSLTGTHALLLECKSQVTYLEKGKLNVGMSNVL